MLSHLSRSLIAVPLVVLALSADVVALGPIRPPEARAQPRALDVPYVPTPMEVVDKMLELAKPGADDYLIDLGCGDGRLPITAAQRFGTQGFGVDLNPQRIKEAKENAATAKVTDKVTFIEGDLFKTDISKATVLTLYLLPSVNMRLRPVILDTLKAGTRVVSHDFDMQDWSADRTEKVGFKTVYHWIVPAKVNGTWQITVDGRPSTVAIDQKFQTFTTAAAGSGTGASVKDGKLTGAAISFTLALPGGAERRLSGTVEGDTMSGEGWTAARRS